MSKRVLFIFRFSLVSVMKKKKKLSIIVFADEIKTDKKNKSSGRRLFSPNRSYCGSNEDLKSECEATCSGGR